MASLRFLLHGRRAPIALAVLVLVAAAVIGFALGARSKPSPLPRVTLPAQVVHVGSLQTSPSIAPLAGRP